MAAAVIAITKFSGTGTSPLNFDTGDVAQFDASGSSGVITRQWVLVSRPEGSVAVLTSMSDVTTQITTDVIGSFLVELIINGGLPSESRVRAVVSTPTLNKDLRIPAFQELLEASTSFGWQKAWRDTVLAFDASGHRILFSATSTVLYTDNLTAVSLFGTGVGSLIVPANYMTPGRILRVSLKGRIQTEIGVGLDVTIKVTNPVPVLGIICVLPDSMTGFFEIKFDLVCRTGGASGKYIIIGQVVVAPTGVPAYSYDLYQPTPLDYDFTQPLTLDVMSAWDVEGPSNILNILDSSVEFLGR